MKIKLVLNKLELLPTRTDPNGEDLLNFQEFFCVACDYVSNTMGRCPSHPTVNLLDYFDWKKEKARIEEEGFQKSATGQLTNFITSTIGYVVIAVLAGVLILVTIRNATVN